VVQGEPSAYLAELVGPEGKVIGVDPEKERIHMAQQTHSGIKRVCMGVLDSQLSVKI